MVCGGRIFGAGYSGGTVIRVMVMWRDGGKMVSMVAGSIIDL